MYARKMTVGRHTLYSHCLSSASAEIFGIYVTDILIPPCI